MTVEWLCNMLIAELPVDVVGKQHQQIDSFRAGEVQNSPYRSSLVKDYRFTSESIKIEVVF